jgi:hypothetical protein
VGIPYPDKPEAMSGKVSFVTDTLLIDMTGGEQLQFDKVGGSTSAKIKTPSEMVFMGPTGDIFTRSAVGDFPEYVARKPAGAAKKEKEPKSEEPGAPSEGGRGKTIFNLGN